MSEFDVIAGRHVEWYVGAVVEQSRASAAGLKRETPQGCIKFISC